MTGKQILYWGSIAAAISAITTVAWGFGEFTGVRPAMIKELQSVQLQLIGDLDSAKSQIDQLSNSLLLLQFQDLMKKREYAPLTFIEQQEMCRIARVLGYVGVPGC